MAPLGADCRACLGRGLAISFLIAKEYEKKRSAPARGTLRCSAQSAIHVIHTTSAEEAGDVRDEDRGREEVEAAGADGIRDGDREEAGAADGVRDEDREAEAAAHEVRATCWRTSSRDRSR